MKEEPIALVESTKRGTAAQVTRPDGVVQIVYNMDDFMDEMLHCSGEWPGCKMHDKRGWKFPGEA